jgi:hypothetical protein
MTQTMYRVLEQCSASELEERLNEMAAEGWELREILPGPSGQRSYDVILVRRRDAGAPAGFHVPRP